MRNYEVHIEGLAVHFVPQGAQGGASAKGLLLNAPEPADVPGLIARARKVEGVEQLILTVPDVDTAWEAFAQGYVRVEAAGGAVSDEQGRLLAIHRLGRWDLPKGKVDRGEALPEAAVREVKEECGLREVSIVRPLCETWHTYARGGRDHLKRTTWFLMRTTGAERLVPQHEEGIQQVVWMDAAGVERMRADTYGTVRAVISAWEAAAPRSRT